MLPLIGMSLAILGSIISTYGALRNNLLHDYRGAMQLWMVSNVLLLAWAVGLTVGLWDGGVSGAALVVMYLIFAVSNFWGMTHG